MTSSLTFAILSALVVSTLLGWFLTSLFLPQRLGRGLLWVLAPAMGLGMCSLVFFVFRRAMFTIEGVLLVSCAVVWMYKRIFAAALRKGSCPIRVTTVALILAAAMSLSVVGLMLEVERRPHGTWDGWAIWNTHARFLYRDGPQWTSDIRTSFHADYPLLAPSVAARFWRYAGHDVPSAGALLGILLALSSVAVLTITISKTRGELMGLVLALVLLGTPAYFDHAVSQYADIPLSFFFLATIALLSLQSQFDSNERGLFILAGFAAGCAGWTKNEGLLFILASSIGVLVQTVRKKSGPGPFLAFLSGLAVPLIVIVTFKLRIAPPNDLVEYQSHTIEKLLSATRHAMILKSFGASLSTFGGWSVSPWIPLLVFIALWKNESFKLKILEWQSGHLILALVVAGYYFVYLTTPLDLRYHLDSSLGRLFLQLWPSVLLLLGLLRKPSDEYNRTE